MEAREAEDSSPRSMPTILIFYVLYSSAVVVVD